MNHYLKYYLIGAAIFLAFQCFLHGIAFARDNKHIYSGWRILLASIFWPMHAIEMIGIVIGTLFRK